MRDPLTWWKTLAGNYWAFGDQWAGISSGGKRFVVKSKSAAISKAGKSTGATKSKPKSTSKRKRSGKTTTKNKTPRRGMRLIGSMGPKGLITCGVLLALSKYISRRFAPQLGAYTTGVSAIGAGLFGKVLGTGSSLLTFGVIDTAAELLTDLALPGGVLTVPGLGPSNGQMRYDV